MENMKLPRQEAEQTPRNIDRFHKLPKTKNLESKEKNKLSSRVASVQLVAKFASKTRSQKVGERHSKGKRLSPNNSISC